MNRRVDCSVHLTASKILSADLGAVRTHLVTAPQSVANLLSAAVTKLLMFMTQQLEKHTGANPRYVRLT